jgi:hypothetical protein
MKYQESNQHSETSLTQIAQTNKHNELLKQNSIHTLFTIQTRTLSFSKVFVILVIGKRIPCIGNSSCSSCVSIHTIKISFCQLRAFGLALVVNLVSVARTFMLISISPRRNAFALLAAYFTILHTPICNPCFRASV